MSSHIRFLYRSKTLTWAGFSGLLLTLTAAALVVEPLSVTGQEPEPASKYVRQLGSASFRVREEANQKLKKLGWKALGALVKARHNADLETKTRVNALLQQLLQTEVDPKAPHVFAHLVDLACCLEVKYMHPALYRLMMHRRCGTKQALQALKKAASSSDRRRARIAARVLKPSNTEKKLPRVRSAIPLLQKQIGETEKQIAGLPSGPIGDKQRPGCERVLRMLKTELRYQRLLLRRLEEKRKYEENQLKFLLHPLNSGK